MDNEEKLVLAKKIQELEEDNFHLTNKLKRLENIGMQQNEENKDSKLRRLQDRDKEMEDAYEEKGAELKKEKSDVMTDILVRFGIPGATYSLGAFLGYIYEIGGTKLLFAIGSKLGFGIGSAFLLASLWQANKK